MADPVAFLDAQMVEVPALLRISLWAIASASFSMWLYVKISPQEKLVSTKEEQKAARAALLRHDGDMQEMQALIKKDLALAFTSVRLILLPFLVSVAPIFLLMYRLDELYPDAYLSFGPDWMRGFDFCYIVVAMVVSMIIKVTCKIA